MNKRSKERKLQRLQGYDYTQSGYYYITICTQNKECYFGNIINAEMHLSEIGEVAEKCWQQIPEHFPSVQTHEYVIMPNHIHGIIIIDNPVGNEHLRSPCSHSGPSCASTTVTVRNKNICSLPASNTNVSKKWHGATSGSLSSIIRGLKIGVTNWCRENNHYYFAWQKSFYDHIIRNEKSLRKIQKYIINNPLSWNKDEFNIL